VSQAMIVALFDRAKLVLASRRATTEFVLPRAQMTNRRLDSNGD
jgi:hypothetical protein